MVLIKLNKKGFGSQVKSVKSFLNSWNYLGMGQNLVPLQFTSKFSWDLWMFIPLKMVCIGIDPYPSHKDALAATIFVMIAVQRNRLRLSAASWRKS